jgi:hypothetical protein
VGRTFNWDTCSEKLLEILVDLAGIEPATSSMPFHKAIKYRVSFSDTDLHGNPRQAGVLSNLP